ncbi:hypothetical protein ZOSMA_135G00010 [Zostera marina]|uniref:Uncharacterized protein n=1 Tax=Zostera marina TaxID=29655 RepID=A0A0K9Q0Q4_ZOSMR|nr:hypothetical protein ZOSMA_135G00010 [Zostera marina]
MTSSNSDKSKEKLRGSDVRGSVRASAVESDRVKADRLIEDIIKDVDFDFSAYDRDSSPDPDQFILSKRKSCRGDKPETSKRKRIDSDFNNTLKKLMEEDRKQMIAKKSGRSPVVQKNSRRMKKKMQASKKLKKAAREIHEERADEDMNDLPMFANEEETCPKILDMNIDTNSEKKRLSSEEKEKKKKKKRNM